MAISSIALVSSQACPEAHGARWGIRECLGHILVLFEEERSSVSSVSVNTDSPLAMRPQRYLLGKLHEYPCNEKSLK